jgi:multisubunit Na+/H+ antiporter MnhB subunit
MEKFVKIIGLHLLILLVYSLFSKYLGKWDGDLTMIIFMVMFVISQTLFCLGIGIKNFTERKKQEGAIYILTGLLVLVIGFVTLKELGSVKNIQVQERNN